MGEYIVNGEVIDISGNHPTAADLKSANNSLATDWVMAEMPDGSVAKVEDNSKLPVTAISYAVVTPYQYGSHWSRR